MRALRARDARAVAPFARAAGALVAYALGREPRPVLEQALAELARADAKQRLAYLLARWAELELERGELALAREQARAGLALAERVQRTSEVMLCRAVLAEAARRAGDVDEAEAERVALRALDASSSTARAQRARERVLKAFPRASGTRQRRVEDGARDRRARVR